MIAYDIIVRHTIPVKHMACFFVETHGREFGQNECRVVLWRRTAVNLDKTNAVLFYGDARP